MKNHHQPVLFMHFPDLPLEIQEHIWDLALQDYVFVRIVWRDLRTGRPTNTMWPLVSLPPLAPTEKPGLIPYVLPPGMPGTLASHPRPWGFPDPGGETYFDQDAYEAAMLRPSRNSAPHTATSFLRSLLRAWAALRKRRFIPRNARWGTGRGEHHPAELRFAGIEDALACFAVCRVSRARALRRTIAPEKPLLSYPDGDPAESSHHYFGARQLEATGARTSLYVVRNGVILGSVFQGARNSSGGYDGHHRTCLVYAIAANAEEPGRSPRFGVDFVPGARSHVAVRLGDLERCIFGTRLSLTRRPEVLAEPEHFAKLRWAMWFRPELGARTRRPEANHPLYCPPPSVLWIYKSLLHRLATIDDLVDNGSGVYRGAAASQEVAACLAGAGDPTYLSSAWYLDLLEYGVCPHCRLPLVALLQRRFPDLLDADGCLDVVILRERGSVEEPEGTIANRSHEIYA